MTDLLARLAQRPPIEMETIQQHKRSRLARAEFDRDLALDALAALLSNACETTYSGDDWRDYTIDDAVMQQVRTVLRELRAGRGEGDSR